MAGKVHVKLAERGYDIIIQSGPDFTEPGIAVDGRRCLIVSDDNVDGLYGEAFERLLEAAGALTARAVVPAGEESKDLAKLEWLYGRALEAGLDRSSLVVALGGGVVGDLAGFLAATYMRGVKLLQVPTSLLAMVDSSVGGKTAVNLPQGKNLVGAFHQPSAVVINLATMATLPEREYVSGIAEVIKYGVIWDAVFFDYLEENIDKLLSRDAEVLEKVVARCCEIKAEVVGLDEREAGVRAILNFGHTLGHALEKVSGYGELLHGEAVAIGMAYAAHLSQNVKGLSADECGRIIDLLRRAGLPVGVPDDLAEDWAMLRKVMSSDKKSVNALPRFVLARAIGEVVFGVDVPETELQKALMLIPLADLGSASGKI